MKLTKKTHILGIGYTHFALDKNTNQIITGWNYSDISTDELREFKNDYFALDLADLEVDFKSTKILNRKNIEKIITNIADSNNWQK